MLNPLYELFATRAGVAGALMRWTVGGLLLYAAGVQIMAALGVETGGREWVAGWMAEYLTEGQWAAAVFGVMGVALLAGFLTRACALLLLGLLLASFSAREVVSPGEMREALLSVCVLLSLVVGGGGRLSVDRRLSEVFVASY